MKTAASISILKNLGGRGGEATCVAMRKSVHTDLSLDRGEGDSLLISIAQLSDFRPSHPPPSFLREI